MADTSTTSQHTDLISRLPRLARAELALGHDKTAAALTEAEKALSDLTTQRDELIEGRDYYAGRYADKCGETIVLTAERAALREALEAARKFAVRAIEANVTGIDFDPATHPLIVKIDHALTKGTSHAG